MTKLEARLNSTGQTIGIGLPGQPFIATICKVGTQDERWAIARRFVASLEAFEALRRIAALSATADSSVGMVDDPHQKALRVASKIASEVLDKLEPHP